MTDPERWLLDPERWRYRNPPSTLAFEQEDRGWLVVWRYPCINRNGGLRRSEVGPFATEQKARAYAAHRWQGPDARRKPPLDLFDPVQRATAIASGAIWTAPRHIEEQTCEDIATGAVPPPDPSTVPPFWQNHIRLLMLARHVSSGNGWT